MHTGGDVQLHRIAQLSDASEVGASRTVAMLDSGLVATRQVSCGAALDSSGFKWQVSPFARRVRERIKGPVSLGQAEQSDWPCRSGFVIPTSDGHSPAAFVYYTGIPVAPVAMVFASCGAGASSIIV